MALTSSNFTGTPRPPDAVNINVTEDGIVISVDNDIHDSQWDLCHYIITVCDKERNVLSRHKLIDTPILIPKLASINFFKVATITLCQQESLSKIIPYSNGGTSSNISNFFSWPVMVAFVLMLVNYM